MPAMPMIILYCLGLAFILFGHVSAWAAEHGLAMHGEAMQGLAMHGEAKYPPDFTAFDYVNPGAPKGGSLHYGVTGSFDSLNPFIVRGRAALGTNDLFEALMVRAQDEPFSLYGLIAEAVELPPDRSWVQFQLRPEARWHDGSSITPEDVLFSWETLRSQGRPNHRAYYNRVSAAQLVGERGVRFAFLPDADGTVDRELPLIIGLMPILSRAWWRGRRFEDTTFEPPLGSGPYRIVAVAPGRAVEYRRLPDYWGRDLPVRRGTNNFDVIRYDYYRDDGVALEAFKAGEADLRREFDPTRWATAYDFPAARDGRVRLQTLSHGRPEPMRAFIFNTRRWPFQDRRVRRALGFAFDFEWINRALFHGAFKRITSTYPNSELAATGTPSAAEVALLEPFRAELPPELFTQAFEPPHTDGSGPSGLRANLREAARLLGESGWRVSGGRLSDADGRPMVFEMLLANPADEKVALEYARALTRLGIVARVRTVDSAQFQGRLDDYDYDVVLHQWLSTLSPGNEQLIFFGSEAADLTGGRNYAGVRSAAVDALALSLGQASDRAALISRVHALDRVLSWGFYGVPLYYLGEDRVASWCGLRRPATVPIYGYVPDVWWREECR
ncbi:MAG: extracellular solute-binding protein [Rhodospirillaceae bacterium]